eukprot:14764108-Alexandrium_andersonii.AAC.1
MAATTTSRYSCSVQPPPLRRGVGLPRGWGTPLRPWWTRVCSGPKSMWATRSSRSGVRSVRRLARSGSPSSGLPSQ